MITLDEFMRGRNITDQALAEQLGVSRPYITRIRNGERQPSLPLAVRLAKLTKLPVSTFVKDAA